MPVAAMGVLSLRNIADEFGVVGEVSMSKMFRDGTIVPVSDNENGAVVSFIPDSGTLRLSSFRGAANANTTHVTNITLDMDYAALAADVVRLEQFRAQVEQGVAAQASLPLSSVTIVSISPGSVKVAANVRVPASGTINAAAIAKLQAFAAGTSDPAAIFGSAFVAQHAVGSVMAVASIAPPVIVGGGAKALVGLTYGAYSTSVVDMFSTTAEGGALTYALVATSSTFGNVSLTGATFAVQAAYRNTAYTATVVATNANGQSSRPATVTVTETVAPAPTQALAFGSVSVTTNTATFTLSSYFRTDAGGAVLEYSIIENPRSSAAIGPDNVLQVTGYYRAETYQVTVRATDVTYGGMYVDSVVTVIEAVAPNPTIVAINGETWHLTVTNNEATQALSSYFANSTIGGLTYTSAITNGTNYANVTTNNVAGTVTVSGANRNAKYQATVMATNVFGKSVSRVLFVYELPPGYTITYMRMGFLDAGGNTWKTGSPNSYWDMLAKYPIGTTFRLVHKGNWFQLRFNSAENGQIRNTSFWTTNVGGASPVTLTDKLLLDMAGSSFAALVELVEVV
jgi:hypothetical protein